MATPYLGLSRIDLLVQIARYNTENGNLPKILFDNSAFINEAEGDLIAACVSKDLECKSQLQVDIDTCINQLWMLKLATDGYNELRSKDWERVIWAAKTMVKIAENGKTDFEAESAKKALAEQRALEKERNRHVQREAEMQRKQHEEEQEERQRKRKIERERELEISEGAARNKSEVIQQNVRHVSAEPQSQRHSTAENQNARHTLSETQLDIHIARRLVTQSKPGLLKSRQHSVPIAQDPRNISQNPAQSTLHGAGNTREREVERKKQKLAEAHQQALRLASEVRKLY